MSSRHSNNTSKSLNDSKFGADSIDSQVLKDNLQEFFKNSKEKLTRLKLEIDELEVENNRQTHENKMLQIRNTELIQYNEELNLRIKGMKEKILIAQKNKSNLQTQTKDIRKDIDTLSKDIDSMKINNQFKVKMVQNEIDHINVIKENSIKSLRNKVQVEQSYQDSLISKMNEIKDEILRYKDLIKSNTKEDNERNNQIIKETNEMTKFLTNL
jgi:chromosome segregation ATPase